MQGSPESSDSTSFPGHSQGDTAGHTDSKSYIRVIQAGPKASEDAELPEWKSPQRDEKQSLEF